MGFIGSNLVKKLHQDQNNNIIILDLFTHTTNKMSFEQFKNFPRVTIFKTDVNNQQMMYKLFSSYKPTRIYHLADESTTKGPKSFIYSNTFGTFNLLEQSRRMLYEHPEMKDVFKFLYLSTDEIYGNLNPEDPKFIEDSKFKPSTSYGASKACGDILVQSWFTNYNLPILIARCSNSYGPYQDAIKLIPKTLFNIIRQVEIPVYGAGDNLRDWIYVEDVVDGLIIIMQNGTIGEVYNISSNKQKTNNQIINNVCEIMQKKLSLAYDPKLLIKYVADKVGHDKRHAIDNTKIKNLGWKSKTSFKKGLQKTITWYLDKIKTKKG